MVAASVPQGTAPVPVTLPDAALAAAHDHWLVGQGRVVALFHAGVKGVAIHVRDGKIKQFRMADKARRMALRAAARRRAGAGIMGQTVAAKRGHGTSVSKPGRGEKAAQIRHCAAARLPPH